MILNEDWILAMNYRYRTSTISFGGPLTPVVKKIIIACVSVFVVQLIARDPITLFFSLTPWLVLRDFYFWQLFTYMFLHGGVFHLVFNMLALFMFGCELERHWGGNRFLRYYILTGVGAGLCVFLFPSNYYTHTLGASGAIYGILLAYGLTFPDRIIYLYMIIPLQAKYFVMVIGGIAFLSALSTTNTGISNIAHLGGMLFGYIYLKRKPADLFSPIKDAYHHWKLRRARKKFEVYLSKKERDRDKNQMIH
jgi:membrane associated rhomboid family serine protease